MTYSLHFKLCALEMVPDFFSWFASSWALGTCWEEIISRGCINGVFWLQDEWLESNLFENDFFVKCYGKSRCLSSWLSFSEHWRRAWHPTVTAGVSTGKAKHVEIRTTRSRTAAAQCSGSAQVETRRFSGLIHVLTVVIVYRTAVPENVRE